MASGRARGAAYPLGGAWSRAREARVSRAYNRSDMLEPRRKVMDEWADFLAGEAESAAKVVSIGSRQKRP